MAGTGAASAVELLRCSQCGTPNRVPLAKIRQGLRPRCGKCKAPLASSVRAAPGAGASAGSGHPVTVTDANFAHTVESSPVPVLLDLWAPWCGPCRVIAPVIEQLATELADRIRVGKLNVDENPATAARFGVQSIPTLLVLRGGREVDRLVGAMPKHEILRRLDALR